MSPEPITAGAIVGGLFKIALPKVAQEIVAKVNSKLNPSELEKALEAGVTAAAQWDESQVPSKWLFFQCEPHLAKRLLEDFFKHTGVQEELQKPLENKGTPDITYLIEVLKQGAIKFETKLNEVSLEEWIRQFINTYFEKTSTYLRFQVAKEDYLTQLANWFDDVKFAGIIVSGQEVEKSEKLAQIFVMSDVVEEVRSSYQIRGFDSSISGDEETGKVINQEGLSNSQIELIRKQNQIAQLDHRSGRTFSAKQLLSESQSQKVVLLGAPGSGKTTLVSYFAVMLAQKHPEQLGLSVDRDWLPILIRIRDLTRHSEISILDYARQFAEKTMSVKALPTGFFEYWLEEGRALILLDGLDEVAEEAKRYQIVSLIQNFLKQFAQNRAIVTSRPAGYKRDFFRTDEFPHYQILPFDEPKIEEFINRWYDSRVRDRPEAERRKDSLKKALSENERIKLLAKNPLLLTIIALIHRYQVQLPRERYKLYEKAVETLLTSWDANKELSNHLVLKYLELDDLRRLLESLAYWIHCRQIQPQGNKGDQEGGTLIDRYDLIMQVCIYIRSQKQIELYKAKKEAENFVDLIQERTGLLNEQGQDCYAFVHKTFQEYLCAQDINYRAENDDDFDIVINQIKEHLHNPHWREVLLLLISQQKPKKAARAIRAVLNHHSDYEQWLHRDLIFAGSCLAENPKELKVADHQLSQEIIEALVELEASNSPQVTDKIRSQVFQALCNLNGTVFEPQALQLLKDREEHINKLRFQEYRAALGEKENAIATLLTLLQDENSFVRSLAAKALGNLGKDSETVVAGLLALLQDQNSVVRSGAARALGDLGKDSETVVAGLLALLQDQNSGVRSLAARALGNLGKDSETVVAGLLALLQDQNSNVRSSAAWALGNLGKDSETVVSGLLPLLLDQDSHVRSSAAGALGNLGKDSETVMSGLLPLLQDQDSHVRSSAAGALGNLGKDSETVMSGLLALLQDQQYIVRSLTAGALGNLGKDLEIVVSGLLALLQDQNSNVRSSAAWALGNLGQGSETVVAGLLPLLQDQEYIVRYSAAWALGSLGQGSETVVAGLLPLLQDQEYIVRSSAAGALDSLGQGSETVVAGLLPLLQDQEYSVRSSAARALGNLGKDSETVVAGLLPLLQDQEYSVRSSAARALGNLGKTSSGFVTVIIQWIEQNQDSEYVGHGIDALWDTEFQTG